MELGALVCVPNGAPLCEQCPLASLCEARRAGTALELPHKAAPKARRIEPVTVVLAEDAEERFLLQQRPQKVCWPVCGSRFCGRAKPSAPKKSAPGWKRWALPVRASNLCRRQNIFSATSSGG